MRVISWAGASIRHAVGAAADAALVAAIGIALVFGVAVASGGNPAGAASVLAGRGGHAGTSTAGSTIQLNAGGDLRLGGDVTFTTSTVDLGGGEYPMVYVACSSDADGSLLYGQLDHPDATFVLGGGSSRWWQVGGSAGCKAWLHAYGGKSKGYDTIRTLAGPISFDAGG